MHQAFHIFRKDVRHSWMYILILLSMLSVLVYLDSAAVEHQRTLIMYRQWLAFILVLAWFYVLATVIQDEPLCGDRQFWITRPYNWRSLAAAKGMFALAFINAPLFASDCVRLWLAGYSPASHIPELLWRQVPLTAGIILVAAAVASVTGGIGHFTLWGLLLIAVTGLCSTALNWAGGRLGSWGGLDWMRMWVAASCLVTVCLFVILRQYSRRTPILARAVLLAGIVLCVLSPAAVPWSLAFAVQSHLPEPYARSAGIRVAFDSSRAAQVGLPDLLAPEDPVHVTIPIHVSGLAPDTELVADTANLSIEQAGLPAWRSGWISRIDLRKESDRYEASIGLDRRLFDRFEPGPLNLRMSMAMTVFAKSATVSAPGPGDFRLTNGLACSIEGWYPREPRLRCTALGRRSRTLVQTENPATGSSSQDELIAGGPYGPDATFFTLSPIAVFGARLPRLAPADQSGSRLVFTTQRPIAHILRELSIPSLRLVSQPKRTT